MRLHLVALPHTRVEPAFCGCAYTAKILKFCRMMGGRHEIFLYSPEGLPVEGVTHVPCLTEAERVETFGADDPGRLAFWPDDDQSRQFNLNVAAAINSRHKPNDLVLLTGGWMHKPIADAHPDLLCVEFSSGYVTSFAPYRVYESHIWRHCTHGYQDDQQGRFFDTVIPYFFDETEFPFRRHKDPFALYVGRLTPKKAP